MACHLSPHSIYIPLSVQTWCVCVFGVVTARLLRSSAYIPFIPVPPGTGPTSPNPCPSVRESDRCRIWQMVDKSMVKWHPRCAYCTDSPQLALNGRMNWFSSGILLNLAPAREVRNQVENTMSTNWIWIKDICVFHKGLEGCLVFSNNRNTSGIDLHCPLLHGL